MKKIIYLLSGISFFVLLASIFIYFYANASLAEGSFRVSVNLTEDTGGFDVSPGALSFGKVPIGGSATRNILIENKYSFPIYVESDVEGTVEDLILFNNLKKVESYQNISISVSAFGRRNFPLGNYEGIFYYKIKRDLGR